MSNIDDVLSKYGAVEVPQDEKEMGNILAKYGATPVTESPKPVGKLEALMSGVASVFTLDHDDELQGLAGIVPTKEVESPYFSPREGMALQGKSPDFGAMMDMSKEDILNAYRKSRDAARTRKDQVIEERPGMFMTGAIGGGALVPAGAGVFKPVKGIADVVTMGALGASAGAIAGSGMSKADLTTLPENPQALEEYGEDIKSGAMLGGLTTGALSAAGKGAGAVGRYIKESESWQDFVDAVQRRSMGQKIVGKAGREETVESAVETAENVYKKLYNKEPGSLGLLQQKAKEIDTLIDSAQQNPELRVPILERGMATREELQKLVDSSSKPEVRKAAQELIETIERKVVGKEQIVGFKRMSEAVPEVSAMDKISKKREELLNRFKAEGVNPATESVKKTAAQQMQKAEELRKAGKLANEALEDLPTVPNFGTPEVVSDAQTGKRLVQMVDSDTGQSVNRAINDLDVSEISEISDEMNRRFYQFVDKGSGKSYRVPINEETLSKIKPVKGRAGGQTSLAPKDARDFRQSVQSFTPIKDPNTPQEVGGIATGFAQGLGDDMEKVIPGMKEANSAYSTVRKTLDRLGVGDNPDIIEAKEKITRKLQTLTKDSPTGQLSKVITSEIIDELSEVNPTLAVQIKDQLMDAAERISLADKSKGPGIVAGQTGSFTLRTGLESIPVYSGNMVGAGKKFLKDSAAQTPEALQTLASKILKRPAKEAQELARILYNASQQNNSKRKALLFGVMQNPKYRQIIEEDATVEEELGN